MNPWLNSIHFKDDKIEFADKTSPELVRVMDIVREASQCKVHIHRVYDPSAILSTSRHRMEPCDAIDFHLEPITPSAPHTLFHQFLFLTRLDGVKGIGIYPHWDNPGFHIDLRPSLLSVYWIRNKDGLYLPVTDKSIKEEVLRG